MRPLRVHQTVIVLVVVVAASASGVALPPPAGASELSKPLVASLGGQMAGGLGGATGVGLSGPLAPSPLGGGLGAGAGPISTLPDLLGLSALGGWVLGGARFALEETATVLGKSTTPQLRSGWFSATYWHMAAIAAVLTLPFLFAAAIQALVRSDLALLLRAAFGYLPLAMLSVAIAAPLTMLVLAASDELSRAVSAASGGADASFLGKAGALIGSLSLASQSPFLAFLVGGFTVAGALVLWIELLIREAAVYVVVLMLPLAFAALVWPARRVWATRTVEVLVALVLSKFAIVAVLSLGGAAMSTSLGGANVEAWLAGLVLVVMAAFTPWALMRFVPVAELAAGTLGGLRHEIHRNVRFPADQAVDKAWRAHDATASAMAGMRREAQLAEPAAPTYGAAPTDGAAATEGAVPSDGTDGTTGARGDIQTADGGEPGASHDEAGSGAATSPVISPAPTSAVSAGAAGAGERPARVAGDAGAGPVDDPATGGDPDGALADVPGFTSRVQLDHPLLLELGHDGSPAWRGTRPAATPGPQGHDDGLRSEALAEHEAVPSAQPPADGTL